jgi:hypothetical protein
MMELKKCAGTRTNYINFTLALFIIFFFIQPVNATVTTIQLQNNITDNLGDTYIRSDSADTNYGTGTVLTTLYSPEYISLIKFNVSSIPAGVVIQSATLHFYNKYNYLDAGEDPIWGVYNVTNQTWRETEVTWNNQPVIGSLIYTNDSFTSPLLEVGWVSWNVTDYAQSEIITSSHANISFAIKDLQTLGESTDTQQFHSKEYKSDITLRPYLNIIFEADIYPPIITILNPENKTYDSTDVYPLITLNEEGDWCGYSLDSNPNISLDDVYGDGTTWSELFGALSDGPHSVVYSCNDTIGNMNSTAVYFAIDTIYPTFSGYARNPAPPNEDQNIQVNVTISESPDTVILEWNGTTNYTITSNNGVEYYFTVNSGNYTAHDLITYYWYVNDSANNQNRSVQQSFTVANRIPTTPTDLTLTNPIYVANTLTATGSGSTDSDAEDTPIYYYEFYNVNDTILLQAYSTDNTYVIQTSDAHDKIRVRTKAYDGYEYSSSEKETNRTVSDTAPTQPSMVILNDSTIYTNDDFLCTASGSTDIDGDTITYSYLFNKTSTTFQDWSTANTFDCAVTGCNKGDTIYCNAIAVTTLANSTVNQTSISILNTLPPLPSGWTNLGTRLTDHTPSISWTEGTDTDGDAVTTIVYVGTTSTPTAQEVNTTSEFTDIGNNIALSDGTTYYYRLRSWDGEDYSSSYTTTDEFRMNDEPTTTTPSIVPSTVYSTTASIMCENGTTTDPDNDTITFHYEWYKNSAALGYNLKNITSGNWTAGDTLICEVYVSDPYETNNTKFNSSAVNVTGYTPVINTNHTYLANNTIDMTPGYGNTVKFNANVTDSDGDLTGVWFTLTAPNGTKVLNNVNGTRYNSDYWNSSQILIDVYGNWTMNITANDTLGIAASQQWNFTVALGTMTPAPTLKTYSQKAGQSEIFNITFSHTGNSNNTYNISSLDYLADSTKFTVSYSEAVTGTVISPLQFIVQEGASYILTVNITSNSSLASANYVSNITFNRTDDGTITNFTVDTTISALSGDVALAPDSWSVSMNDAQSSSQTFTVTNNGDYALSGCITNMSLLQSFLTVNTSSFSVAVGSSADVLVTLSSITAGTYSDTMTVTCYATASSGIDTDTSSVSATITAAPAAVIAPGGGGGGYVPPDYTTKPTDIFELDLGAYQVITRYVATLTNQKYYEFRILNKMSVDLNMTLSIECSRPSDPSCGWIYFIGENGTMIQSKDYMVARKAGLTAGLLFNGYIHSIPKSASIGNYTYLIRAKTDGGTVQDYPVILIISDKSPSFSDMFGGYIIDNQPIMVYLALFMLFTVVAIVWYSRRRKRSRKSKDKSVFNEDTTGQPSMTTDDEFI